MEIESALGGRPVFVTGAGGFVGSHLTEKLVVLGADVHVFLEANTPRTRQNLNDVWDELSIYSGDLRDAHSVRRALRNVQGCSECLIFHLGAQAHVGESWERPYETIETNVNGTLNVLEAIVSLDLDVSKIVTAGSSEEYGNGTEAQLEHDNRETDSVALDELSPVNPKSVYATSKVAADFLTMNYHDAYALPAVTTRMFNNYGPRQSPRYITGTIITQALKREYVEVGNLTPQRDMCYVCDGIRGHLHVALEGTPGERYVFGSGETVSMREWAELILDIGREKGYWENVEILQKQDRYRPGDSEVDVLLADFEKLHEKTGWEPTVSRRDGIAETIAWFHENANRWQAAVDWK